MPAEHGESASFTWLAYALLTVVAWGVYGVMLHTGQIGMADPANGRYKAFLFVGIAYFLTAILAPLVVLALNGASWQMPAKGVWWSLGAGIVGALGAFGVLLAFGAKGSPPVVMAIVFAGAPIINAFAAMALHPPPGGFAAIRWPFYVGLLMAAIGGCLVSLYRPPAAPAAHAAKPPLATRSPRP